MSDPNAAPPIDQAKLEEVAQGVRQKLQAEAPAGAEAGFNPMALAMDLPHIVSTLTPLVLEMRSRGVTLEQITAIFGLVVGELKSTGLIG